MSTVVDDDLWSAIGDPTRRTMIDLLLADGPGTATTLSERLPVTRQAVSKHLAVLDRVGLVRAEPVGRERHFHLDEHQLARAVAQLSSVGATWDARLRRIKRIAEAIERERTGGRNARTSADPGPTADPQTRSDPDPQIPRQTDDQGD